MSLGGLDGISYLREFVEGPEAFWFAMLTSALFFCQGLYCMLPLYIFISIFYTALLSPHAF